MKNLSHWLTPVELYDELNSEFGFDFDPCPQPRPEGYDSLVLPWGKSNFVNPPFRKKDGFKGHGPTAFVRKAIAESELGKSSVLLLPTQSYVNLLLESGASCRSVGRVPWLEINSRLPVQNPSSITCFILRGIEPGRSAR